MIAISLEYTQHMFIGQTRQRVTYFFTYTNRIIKYYQNYYVLQHVDIKASLTPTLVLSFLPFCALKTFIIFISLVFKFWNNKYWFSNCSERGSAYSEIFILSGPMMLENSDYGASDWPVMLAPVLSVLPDFLSKHWNWATNSGHVGSLWLLIS